MKKALILLLVLVMISATVACNRGGTDDPPETSSSSLALIENGVGTYFIVRSDTAGDTETDAAVRLRRCLREVTGVNLTLATDWDTEDNSQRLEILVGKTNREESIAVMAELGENEYAVRTVGDRIVICGNGDEALNDAVSWFLLNCVGYDSEGNFEPLTEINIMKDLNYKSKYDDSKRVVLLVTPSAPSYVADVESALGTLTSKVIRVDCNEGTDYADIFDAGKNSLVVVAGADSVPYGVMTAADAYLKNGGRLMTLGAPTFTTTLYPLDTKWYSRNDYYTAMASNAANLAECELIIDTSDKSVLNKFIRGTDNPSGLLRREPIEDGRVANDDTPPLKITIGNLTGWDISNINIDIPDGHNAIGFWAMGDENTDSLYVEIIEKDASRWVTTVDITAEWQYYVLTASDFTYYKDNTSVGRGGEGDTVKFDGAKTLSIGLARSHQAGIETGKHVFWIDDVCSLESTLESEASVALDGFAPEYKFFPVTNADTVKPGDGQIIVSGTGFAASDKMVSVPPGRTGSGYNNNRLDRFIPLIETYDSLGLRSGFAAWMYIYCRASETVSDYEGAVLASFGAGDGAFYNDAGIAAIRSTAQAMLSDAFLIEGGAESYIYVESDTDKVTAGTVFTVSSELDGNPEIRMTFLQNGDNVLEKLIPLSECKKLKTRGNYVYYTYETSYETASVKPDTIITDLMLDSVPSDRIMQEVTYWSPKPEAERNYIYTENGNYMQDGKILKLYGINYMPTAGGAAETYPTFNTYTSDTAYDPVNIRHDLLRLKEIGFNAVSVFGYDGSNSNMLHLIELCDELGFYADVFISGAYPFGSISDSLVANQITKWHLNEHDNIIAFDIAWESTIGTYDSGSLTAGGRTRQDLDPAWRKWIDEQYGSLAAAEAAWGVKAPRNGSGDVIGATDAMLRESGGSANSALVAAYRRFIDDTVSRTFYDKLNYMRGIDPNHLISFRMQTAGSATSDPAEYHYDFQSTAPVLDFMSPEGYALNAYEGSDNTFEGVFANIYARMTNPGRPVNWKEFGFTVWNGSNFTPSESKLECQAQFYRAMNEMFLTGDTGACFCWYSIGGFRPYEKSDFGIFNPDGSDRPVTAVIREYSAKFLAVGEQSAPDYFITIDRDIFPNSITGMYKSVHDELQSAIESGNTVAFVTEGHGKTATEVADIAVGGAKTDSGLYPRKYLNGMFLGLTDRTDAAALLTVRNTQYATWAEGEVSVIVTDSAGASHTFALDGTTSYLGDASVTLDLSAFASGNCVCRLAVGDILFAPSFTFTK